MLAAEGVGNLQPGSPSGARRPLALEGGGGGSRRGGGAGGRAGGGGGVPGWRSAGSLSLTCSLGGPGQILFIPSLDLHPSRLSLRYFQL